MAEPVVGAVMTTSPISVRPDASFKQVACALFAADVSAIPVVSGGLPVGMVTELDVLANLEFHGGIDPIPVLGGGAARRRRRKARAVTAAELMTSPPPTISADAPVGAAAARLVTAALPALCVVDGQRYLTGLLTRRDLLAAYRRPDDEIAAEVRAVVDPGGSRPARGSADLSVQVCAGIVELDGSVVYRSQVEQAAFAISRVAGVIAVRNNLSYDIDDMMVTGF
ncbi:CBS domain-containing protein [Kribbella antibiotica]|uniref:CBS domain-containing protein n=1 Tax=Kribbella antibiotica TaxID=190195 RepID=A0A4R4ZTP2_9ACTN|nr:CBS domain-containing protein [Kribbella antibiotica]TDD61504.1 CBS domain-containing protein [Kribbella antibiotica]